jgi:hypothetical protein
MPRILVDSNPLAKHGFVTVGIRLVADLDAGNFEGKNLGN